MKLLWLGAPVCAAAFLCCADTTDRIAGGVPFEPDASATTGSNTSTFAIDVVFLGESDLAGGAPSNTAWKTFGYNLDGLTSTKDSTDVCTLHSGAPKSNQADGINGIDNSFGSTILSILETSSGIPTPSAETTRDLRDGFYTLQIQIDRIPDHAYPTTAIPIRVFRSLRSGEGAPLFDQTTDWPVLASSLNGTHLASAKWQTANAYIADDGTWVAELGNDDPLLVPVMFGLKLPIRHAVITFSRTSSDPTHLRQGTIAGVALAEDVVKETQRLAGQISPSLCGSAFTGIADQLRQASDIMHDGTNTFGQPCDSISIGIAFDAVQIANPTTIVPDPGNAADPCAPKDAGAD